MLRFLSVSPGMGTKERVDVGFKESGEVLDGIYCFQVIVIHEFKLLWGPGIAYFVALIIELFIKKLIFKGCGGLEYPW
ncbi:pentatricopeptide repeat-containing protein [Sesbania bispinosa]|nr:pentatricopeptide repeat-containing protein [Sesbania bispinosa]